MRPDTLDRYRFLQTSIGRDCEERFSLFAVTYPTFFTFTGGFIVCAPRRVVDERELEVDEVVKEEREEIVSLSISTYLRAKLSSQSGVKEA
jgi:hypothetical protein